MPFLCVASDLQFRQRLCSVICESVWHYKQPGQGVSKGPTNLYSPKQNKLAFLDCLLCAWIIYKQQCGSCCGQSIQAVMLIADRFPTQFLQACPPTIMEVDDEGVLMCPLLSPPSLLFALHLAGK